MKHQGLNGVPWARLAHGCPLAVHHAAAFPSLTLPLLLQPSFPLYTVMNCCCLLPCCGQGNGANQYSNQAAWAKPSRCLPTSLLANTERTQLLLLPAQAQPGLHPGWGLPRLSCPLLFLHQPCWWLHKHFTWPSQSAKPQLKLELNHLISVSQHLPKPALLSESGFSL